MKKIISGKVREVYDLEDGRLVIVTTDRISAFDVILPSLIPDKGKVLTEISSFWFDYTKDIVKNHIISDNLADMPAAFQKPEFEGRTVMVKKLKMANFEFIVRGYMFGSMWDAYQKNEPFCGYTFDRAYQKAEKLDTPILTPSTKATEGHDIYVHFDELVEAMGADKANEIKDVCIALYNKCFDYAASKGIILADTKFEFGYDENGELVIGDEMFTPDSSRFWDLAAYKIGTSPSSFDKQFVRDWLTERNINGKSDAQPLPAEVIEKTSAIYKECVTRLKG
ncbi:MAG: phosphoribosylaminoimidazolesuccinocarboxamide synthase [Oscillospiraceae bacterium]